MRQDEIETVGELQAWLDQFDEETGVKSESDGMLFPMKPYHEAGTVVL